MHCEQQDPLNNPPHKKKSENSAFAGPPQHKTAQELNAYGEDWFAAGNREKAAAAFEQAIEADPYFAPAWNNLGVLWYSENREKAKTYLETAYRLAPGDKSAVLNIGRIYAGMEEYERARSCYAGYLNACPEDEDILQRIAELPEYNAPAQEKGSAGFKAAPSSNKPHTDSRTHPLRVELGAGGRKLQGWISLDKDPGADLCHDLTDPLPFEDKTVDELYASHVLEHFSYPQPMCGLLAECWRVLKPGGRLRVSVPNARIYLEAYFNPEGFDPGTCRYKPAFHYNSKIDFVNYIAYMDGHHRYMFDEENLVAVLQQSSFKHVGLRDFDPAVDLEKRRYESIYAEAYA